MLFPVPGETGEFNVRVEWWKAILEADVLVDIDVVNGMLELEAPERASRSGNILDAEFVEFAAESGSELELNTPLLLFKLG